MKSCGKCIGCRLAHVAPFAGAWIEIDCIGVAAYISRSLPSRERGLKLRQLLSIPTRMGSLPSRERGLKLFQSENPVDLFRVAPFAGAWIEIRLKVMMNQREIVAPFAGAWIEIISGYDCFSTDIVAPFAGAWIEIQNSFPCLTKWKSLPSRERGLKFNSNCKYDNSHYVAPFAGAWIEISSSVI